MGMLDTWRSRPERSTVLDRIRCLRLLPNSGLCPARTTRGTSKYTLHRQCSRDAIGVALHSIEGRFRPVWEPAKRGMTTGILERVSPRNLGAAGRSDPRRGSRAGTPKASPRGSLLPASRSSSAAGAGRRTSRARCVLLLQSARTAAQRDCPEDAEGTGRGENARESVRVPAQIRSERWRACAGHQERLPCGACDRRDRRLHLARPAAACRVPDYAGSSVGGVPFAPVTINLALAKSA